MAYSALLTPAQNLERYDAQFNPGLPEGDHRIQRERNDIALRLGLPPVGATMTNRHGIDFHVDGHYYARTLASFARDKGKPAVHDGRDLYPILIPENLSKRLNDLIGQTDICTSQGFMVLDTVPWLRPNQAHPDGHWVDAWDDPEKILVFLDAANVHETIFAHEIGHVFIDVVDGCEDYRVPRDLNDTGRAQHIQHVQSFVLDLKVNDLLRSRCFDMEILARHEMESINNLALALAKGYLPPYPREAGFMALTVATSLLAAHRESAALVPWDSTLPIIQAAQPGVYDLAHQMVESVRRNGYETRDAVRKTVDECLELSFASMGEPFEVEADLVEQEPERVIIDKYPAFAPQLLPSSKFELGKMMARNDIDPRTEYHMTFHHLTQAAVRVRDRSGEWTEPIMLPRKVNPEEIMARRPKFPTPMAAKPPTPMMPDNAIPNQFRPRHYLPGLARFLTRVRLAEQLAGEHPYAYAFNNPVTYTDPSGRQPAGLCAHTLCEFLGPGVDPLQRQPGQKPRPKPKRHCLKGKFSGCKVLPGSATFCDPRQINIKQFDDCRGCKNGGINCKNITDPSYEFGIWINGFHCYFRCTFTGQECECYDLPKPPPNQVAVCPWPYDRPS